MKDYVVEFEQKTYSFLGSSTYSTESVFARGFTAKDVLDCDEQARKWIEEQNAGVGIFHTFYKIRDIRGL